jgi:hypothetical protein
MHAPSAGQREMGSSWALLRKLVKRLLPALQIGQYGVCAAADVPMRLRRQRPRRLAG